ncbi:probable H/ACA ribonucleoprotein complex subunit 1 [Mangifera indica]|uniref:probable H/ACA ribonucleoprotein complex subunit 1 n=1 Tax=Mangifera indica TaxID=29780 RepID=UPI001CF998F9|nr:probable H/ACA ribonucleoprotein complex subunit 1 [Mangifera indica]
MTFIKQRYFFLLLFFQHLLAHQLSQKPLLHTEFPQNFTLNEGEKKVVVSVNRRGGGGHAGGGHAGGGHAGGSGRGDGGRGGHEGPGRGAVIPLYVAGAGGYHGHDRHHHGSNSASPGNCGLCHLVLSIFISVVFLNFV